MMKIKDIFTKPIDRNIKGVITIGDEQDANVKQELEEYVVTKELDGHFKDFSQHTRREFNTIRPMLAFGFLASLDLVSRTF
ncbi:hypothetical protein L3X07_04700 [Levilactobacillus brevis]|nr:hypothetical protein [Levilactobacillus brevis]